MDFDIFNTRKISLYMIFIDESMILSMTHPTAPGAHYRVRVSSS